MQAEEKGMEEHCKTSWPSIYQNTLKCKNRKVYKTHTHLNNNKKSWILKTVINTICIFKCNKLCKIRQLILRTEYTKNLKVFKLQTQENLKSNHDTVKLTGQVKYLESEFVSTFKPALW